MTLILHGFKSRPCLKARKEGGGEAKAGSVSRPRRHHFLTVVWRLSPLLPPRSSSVWRKDFTCGEEEGEKGHWKHIQRKEEKRNDEITNGGIKKEAAAALDFFFTFLARKQVVSHISRRRGYSR